MYISRCYKENAIYLAGNYISKIQSPGVAVTCNAGLLDLKYLAGWRLSINLHTTAVITLIIISNLSASFKNLVTTFLYVSKN